MIQQINEHSLVVRRTEELKNRAARRCRRQMKMMAIAAVIMIVILVNVFLAHRDPTNAQLDRVVAQAAARANANAEAKGVRIR
ncbi:MAG: hypothetical protein ACYC0V_00305 [Armatimonadota bacterium]